MRGLWRRDAECGGEIRRGRGRAINSNDGLYCGAYVAAMYSLAFESDDMKFVASEALKALPAESRIRKMMSDIIEWHRQDPSDWKAAWRKFEDKYVKKHDDNFGSCHIHAPNNCAYILLGLLYGNGDFEKTIDISTRLRAGFRLQPREFRRNTRDPPWDIPKYPQNSGSRSKPARTNSSWGLRTRPKRSTKPD